MNPPDRPQPPYERLERYELGPEQRLVTQTRLRRGIAAGLVIEVIVIGLAVLGAWLLLSGLQFRDNAASEASDRSARNNIPERMDDPHGSTATGRSRDRTSSTGYPKPSGASSPTGAIGTVLYSGTATWYCGQGSPCTRGYGPLDMVAAIDPTLGIAKGERVRVSHEGKSVTVRIVDVCACAGARLIDLTSGAFLRLASTDLGVIPVELETLSSGDAVRTLPPTDSLEDTP